MAKGDVRVTPDDGRWKVKSDGASKAAGIYENKHDAVEAGEAIAKNHRSELTVHGRDGKIQSKDSFGNDPIPPRDKEH